MSKKILLYTTSKIYTSSRITGGIKRFRLLYDHLADNGNDVTLCCGETSAFLKKHRIKSFYSLRIPETKSFLPSLHIMLQNKKVLRKIKNAHYDTIIVFDVPAATTLALLNFRNVVLCLRQDLILYKKISFAQKNFIYRSIYFAIAHFCEYLCCKTAKKIIVQCKYDLKHLLERHKCIRKNIEAKSYIQINNVNPPWIVSNSKAKKAQLNFSQSKSFRVCFVGDFSNPRKGHDLILPAIHSLNNEGDNVSLLVVGGGNLLQKYRENYKRDHNIKFMGKKSNPIVLMKQADLVVVPSLADSCPNTIFEALYNNVPVVATRVGGIPEILKNKQALFEPTVASLKTKVHDLLRSQSQLNTLLRQQKLRKKQLTFDWSAKIMSLCLEDEV